MELLGIQARQVYWMCKISYWVDLSGCGGTILLVLTVLVTFYGLGKSYNFTDGIIYCICPLGWLGLHAAACANAASHALWKRMTYSGLGHPLTS
jgi:hypothetical protein